MKANIEVFRPMPNISVTTAIALPRGLRRRVRQVYRRSCHKPVNSPPRVAPGGGGECHGSLELGTGERGRHVRVHTVPDHLLPAIREML